MLEKRIKEIKSDKEKSQQIASLQSENIKLLKELESLSDRLKVEAVGQYRNLIREREGILDKLEKNQNSIRITFEKGALLNLAAKNKNELEERKRNIEEALQFYADNMVMTLGEPKIRNNGTKSDIFIDVEWHIKNKLALIEKISLFYNPDDTYTHLLQLLKNSFAISGR